MKLDMYMKKLMAYLYATPKFKLYDFSFDKRDNLFKVTIYLTDSQYWTVLFVEDKIHILEWHTNQSSWYPGNRVTYLNKYLKKFKTSDRNKYYWYVYADCTVEDLIKALDKMSEPLLKVEADNRKYAFPARKGGVIW